MRNISDKTADSKLKSILAYLPKTDEYDDTQGIRIQGKLSLEEIEKNKIPTFVRHGQALKINYDAFDITKYELSNQKNSQITCSKDMALHGIKKAPKHLSIEITEQLEYEDFWKAMGAATCSEFTIAHCKEKEQTLDIQFPQTSKSHIVGVVAEKDTSCTVTIRIPSFPKAAWQYLQIYVIAKENAIVEIALFAEHSKNNNTVRCLRGETFLHSGSDVKWSEAGLGTALYLSEVNHRLDGEQSRVATTILLGTNGTSRADNNVVTTHNNKNTTSDLSCKAVAFNQSQLLARGLVRINSTGAHADGYQKADVLVIGENASANAIPQLEINNNEVRCTHGATVGKIDKEQLFYLTSRGIKQHVAEQLIVSGFFGALITRFPESLSEDIMNGVDTLFVESQNH